MPLSTQDEDTLARATDATRAVTEARDGGIGDGGAYAHGGSALALDGVHLPNGARNVRDARKLLGAEAIVGAFCGASRHDGMTAGEHGADYISFGPVGQTNLGTARTAGLDLFEWWSEMIELPVVAEGQLNTQLIAALSDKTDFIALGPEIWWAEDALLTLKALTEHLS